MPDITSLIMDDHEWFRRQFAALDDAREESELSAVWKPLAARLQTHAEAEEAIFYPHLLKRADKDRGETKDALQDHNKIRRAVADAKAQDIGSRSWSEAVDRTRTENSNHLAEEENKVLPDFRKHASLPLRNQLGFQWLRFYADHPAGRGVSGDSVDVTRYLNENKP